MRPFEPRDDEAVAALFARIDAREPSFETFDLERWRAFRSELEGGRRFVVALRDGRIVGLSTLRAFVDRRAGLVWRVRIFVDPSEWRRGIGRALLVEREAQAARSDVHAIETFVDARRTAARAFAEAHGYEVFCHDLFLTRDARALVVPPVDGVTLRRGTEADHGTWVRLFNATLSRDVVFVEATLESVAAHARSEGFALWLAERDGVALGFCHVERRGRLGYIQSIGVLAEHEGRGVGAALLASGIETLRESVDRIELCTEKDNVRAQRLYARAGFALDREAFTYRKKIVRL